GGGSENDLLALLRRIRQPVWIMLDDYPRDSSPELDDCLDLLLDMGPSTVSWWVTSRRQPAWKLPRLLLQGHLFELEAEALAFTADELEQVL
ncbi:MAG TPA: helix-turn-helix transcriptional regulator, partial [Pseudomonas sp.]|nr:helix-turn-helix transcriptional regulator [Pseudomonas sp.]